MTGEDALSAVLSLVSDSGLQRKLCFITLWLSLLLFSYLIPPSISQTWYYLGAVGNLKVYIDDAYIIKGEMVDFKFENNYDHHVRFYFYVKHDDTGDTICGPTLRDVKPHDIAYITCTFYKECENSVYIKDLYGYYIPGEEFPIAPGVSKVGSLHVHENGNCVPEFPLGLPLEILFIPVIIYMLWRSRPRKKLQC